MNNKAVNIGTIGFPRGRKAALEMADLVELVSTHSTPPRQSVGRRWREEAGPGVRFTIQAPRCLVETPTERAGLEGDWRAHGGFRQTRENSVSWSKSLAFAQAVSAEAIVLLTGSSFTPSKTNIDAFSRFLGTCERQGLDLVWEPRGPWEPERTAELARAHDVILACDPLRDPELGQEKAYFRLGPFAAGTSTSRISVYNLEKLVEAMVEIPRVTCVLDTPRALDDVRNLKEAWANRISGQN